MNSSLLLESLQHNTTWQLHNGLRLNKNGVITLPTLHSTAASLKWKRDFCSELGTHYIYVESIHISTSLRRQGLATRLLHILCTAVDKSPQRYDIGLVASPAAGSGQDIVELEEWYKRRGFTYCPISEMMFRTFSDKRIYKIRSKYASTF